MFVRIVVIFFLIPVFSVCQSTTSKINQITIDSFAKNKLNKKTLPEFRNMLESNDQFYGWAKYYTVKGYWYYKDEKYELARTYIDSALSHYDEVKITNAIDEESLLQAYMTLGYIDRGNADYEASNENFFRALDLEKKYPYKYVSYIRAYVAGNHLSMGDEQCALKYYHLNKKDSLYMSLAQPAVVTYTRLGALYLPNYLNNRDSSIVYSKKAEEHSFKLGYRKNLPFIYSNLGRVYEEVNTDSALYYYKKSKDEYNSYVIDNNISPSNSDLEILVNTTFVDIMEENWNNVIGKLEPVIEQIRNNVTNKNDRDILLRAYNYLVQAFEEKEQFKNANTYIKQREDFTNKFHKIELSNQLRRIEVAYETEKKEDQINALTLAAKNKDLEISKRNWQLLLLGAGSLLLLTLAFLIYRNRVAQAKIERLRLEQRLLRLQMNPHFMFNVLQSIYVRIDQSKQKAKELASSFGALLRLILDNSNEEYVLLKDELEVLKTYMHLYSETVPSFDHKIIMDEEVDDNALYIPPMIIQPIVENAVKHGIANLQSNRKISIKLFAKAKNHFKCEVCDTGDGFDKHEKSTRSKGLTIIEKRLQAYFKSNKKEVLEVSKDLKSGETRVVIRIPHVS